MPIDYESKSKKIYQKIKSIGVPYKSLVEDKVDTNEPWKKEDKLIHGGNIHALILPIGSGLGYAQLSPTLVSMVRLELMFVIDDDVDISEIKGIEIKGTEYRILKIETLQPTGIPLLYYCWLS